MAKIAFSKLNKKVDNEPKIITIDGNNIEVKQYLPISQKWEMIREICINALEPETKFFNPISIEVSTALNTLFYYTNISFTDKQKEDTFKLYDMVVQNGLLAEVYANIPESEHNFILDIIEETITSNENYNFSALGIIENVVKNYGQTEFDVEKLREKLANNEGMELLKEIAPLLNLA